MNGSTPPPVPAPLTPGFIPPSRPQALGEDPQDIVPIAGVFNAVESMLRHPRRIMFHLRQPGAGRILLSLLLIALVCSAVYGVVVGTFSKGDQLWAAPLKISVGLLISALICLPSLYIFACLSGAQVRLAEAAGLVIGLIALLSVLLVGFAPVAWVFSESTQSLPAMGALHLAFALIAAGFGLRFLGSGLIHAQAGATGMRVWSIIFVVVLLQMTTALRPILGTADSFLPTEKKFFISHWSDALNEKNHTRATRNP